jgi:hypothetical protein
MTPIPSNISSAELSALVAVTSGAKIVTRLNNVGVVLVDFGQGEQVCPPYAESLDAVLPLVSALKTREEQNTYLVSLMEILKIEEHGPWDNPQVYRMCNATARQHCFALLAAKGHTITP